MPDTLLAVVAAAVAATPLALAFAVDYQVRSFQRQAFGHLRRAARNLRLMAWVIFAYYVAVLAFSYWAGDLQQTAELPLSPEGWAVYFRIGAAILAYALAIAVARELYLVTKPGRTAHDSMRPL